jgi:hypothetical protein
MAAEECSLTGLYDDVYMITAVPDTAGDEFCSYYKDLSSLALSTTLYTKFLVRWKTSVGSNGMGIRVKVTFDDASDQLIVGSTNPEFSQTWTVTAGTLTTGKTIDKVYIYADDYPDSVGDGAPGTNYYVYCDFIFFYKANFTLPNYPELELSLPPRYAIIPIPSRVGDITQNLGSESTTVRIPCDLNIGDWTRSGDYVDGEVFYEIAHGSSINAWNWLSTSKEQFKVTLETPVVRRSQNAQTLDLLFREYRRSDAANETWVERFGLNLASNFPV